jgi:3-hydroxyisobutyrate dehydrogenase-like beta-hydroxyacid dehydrogenase
MTKSIGIVGLGRIGMVAAEKFIDSGYQVIGCDLRAEATSRLEAMGGIIARYPAQVAASAETVLILVLNDDQVIEALTGQDGVLEGTSPGSTIICMSTINRGNLEWLSEQCAEKGVGFMDCPFTGGPARVAAGTLTLIGAGPPDIVEKAGSVLTEIGTISLVGDTPGMGQAVKHCNQLLVTAVHAATMELITLAEKSGADPKQVCDIVGNGIAGNDYFRLLSKAILENSDSPGGMGQLWKDVNIVVTTAREHNLPLLVTLATAQYFNMGVAQDMENEDSARLIEVLRKMIGE